MHKLLIQPSARNDIKKIWHYTYKNWGEQQADAYIESLGSIIETMPENPEMGSDIHHIRKNYRLYHFKHHFIIYRLTSTSINIVCILGESMLIKHHL